MARFLPFSAFLVALSATFAHAGLTFSVDFDPDTPGIQDTVDGSIGDTITGQVIADFQPDVDFSSTQGFTLSVAFDSDELTGTSFTAGMLPGGFNLGAGGTLTEDSGLTISPFSTAGLSQNESLTAGFGGAITSPFSIAAFTFELAVDGADDAGVIDILPFVRSGADNGFVDVAGTSLSPEDPTFSSFVTFNGGSVVSAVAIPEPTSLVAFGLAAGCIALRRRRR